ncbi:hypothetical protein [Oceanospirillum beijerinckii]|uniref:hypothetical protein n=1 Tax=Oceanospirillum beijerinckii TaxID=64976 RepID=UPI0003F81BB1|nr:hypothetical protein [Oceanospirillum beijerinckii]
MSVNKGYDDIVVRLLNGASLSSVMVPDPALPSNQPAHDETYKMNFIYFDGNKFFAHANMMHRGMRPTPATGQYQSIQAFCYSYGYNGLMIINTPYLKYASFGDISGRYSEFKWVVRDDFETVWDSDKSSNTNLLRKAVLEGRDIKMAIKDDEGYWSVLPADLVNIDQGTDNFNIRSETGTSDVNLHNKEKGLNVVLEHVSPLLKKDSSKFVICPSHSIQVYYACFSDGTYYNHFDEARETVREYQGLKIFARKDMRVSVNEYPYNPGS